MDSGERKQNINGRKSILGKARDFPAMHYGFSYKDELRCVCRNADYAAA